MGHWEIIFFLSYDRNAILGFVMTEDDHKKVYFSHKLFCFHTIKRGAFECFAYKKKKRLKKTVAKS